MPGTLRPNLLLALRSLADPASPVKDFETALSFLRTFSVGTDGSMDPELDAAFLNAHSAIRLRRQLDYKLRHDRIEDPEYPGRRIGGDSEEPWSDWPTHL
jgi:hypothetical protein